MDGGILAAAAGGRPPLLGPARGGLDRLLARMDRVLPGLCCAQPGAGQPGARLPVLTTQASHPGLSEMRDYWAGAYPEAGPHYLAMRCWGLAVWQPIYLCVLAAHLDTAVPRLDGVLQPWSRRDGFTRGLWLPAHEPVPGPPARRMALGAAEIARFCGLMRAAARRVLTLKDRTAEATVAECLLAAILLAARKAHAGQALTRSWAASWLRAVGVENGCGLLTYRNARGDPALMLERTVCCHHFRRRDGDKCASCPKLPVEARIARTLADAS